MDIALVMFKADGQRREFPITHPVTIIGRKHTCDLRVPISSISREHCQVEMRDDGAYIRDLGSSNGTYFNDQRVTEARLGAGDTIVVGPVHFTVVVDGEPSMIDMVKTVLPGGGEVEDLHRVGDEPPSVVAESDEDAALELAAAMGESDRDEDPAVEIEPDDSDDEVVVERDEEPPPRRPSRPATPTDDEPRTKAPASPAPPRAERPAPAPPPPPSKPTPAKPAPLKPAGTAEEKKLNTDDALSTLSNEETEAGVDDPFAALSRGGGGAAFDDDPIAALEAMAQNEGPASEDDALAWLEEDEEDDQK